MMLASKMRSLLCVFVCFLVISCCFLFKTDVFALTEDEEEVITGVVRKQSKEVIEEEKRLKTYIPNLVEIAFDSAVYAVIFSPDNKYLITGEKNGAIRVWNVVSNYSMVSALEGHTKEIYGMDISKDGKYLVSGGADQLIKVWDAAENKLVKTIRDYSGTVTALKFSPDNSVLASANLENTIEFWSAEEGGFYYLDKLTGLANSMYSLSFYPTSTYLAAGGKDKMVHIWPLAVEDKVKTLKNHTHLVLDVEFSPKGNFLASGGADNMVYLWELSFKEDKLILEEEPVFSYVHKGWVTKAGFSPEEDYLITGSQYGQLRVWDLYKKKLLRIVSVFSEKPIFDFAFSSDGKYLAVAGQKGLVFVYKWEDIIFPPQNKVIKNSNLLLQDNLPLNVKS
jgi:WD40 repeat protein